MDFNLLADQFWREGYLVIEDMFPASLMDLLQQRILGHFGEQPDYFHNQEFLEKSATEVVPWFPQREGELSFDQVDQDPRFEALSHAILGQGWQALYSMVMFSKAGSKGQAWHQDCPPENADRFNLNRLVYTMDIDEQTGGHVLVVPGSHQRGELTTGQVDEDLPDQLLLTPKKGTLVIIHGHTWHRVLPVGPSYRVSTNFRAIPKGTDEDITDICVYRNMRYQFSTNKVVVDRT